MKVVVVIIQVVGMVVVVRVVVTHLPLPSWAILRSGGCRWLAINFTIPRKLLFTVVYLLACVSHTSMARI